MAKKRKGRAAPALPALPRHSFGYLEEEKQEILNKISCEEQLLQKLHENISELTSQMSRAEKSVQPHDSDTQKNEPVGNREYSILFAIFCAKIDKFLETQETLAVLKKRFMFFT